MVADSNSETVELTVTARRRVAFITNSPAPYRDQLYRALASRFSEVRVFYTEPEQLDRGWKTDEGVPARRLRPLVGLGPAGAFQPDVASAVRGADVVFVGGYETCTYVLAMVCGRLFRRRVVLFFDGVAPSRLTNRGFRYWLKRVLVRLPHLCLVNGAVGREYFEDVLGVPANRVRNQFLVPKVPAPTPPSKERTDVLFVGRLIERKGVDVLLEAMKGTDDLSVTIIGDGPNRARLERLAAGMPVRFLGEVDRVEVDSRLQSARCLVVPSFDEPWGLVVQEAMCWNLPVVVSDDVSSAHDLVVDGVNGYMFPAGDRAALRHAIREAMRIDPLSLAKTNTEVLRRWSLDAHVAAFVAAAN